MSVRVAAVQCGLYKASYEKVAESIAGLVGRAAVRGAQIVCLPEHWLLDYKEHHQPLATWLAEVANKHGVYLVTGANYTPTAADSKPRIRSTVVGPGGVVLGHQDKVHLFRGETEVASPGTTYEVIPTPLGKLGITICYDNVFPEACRTLALKGADLIFVPSRIRREGLDPWLLYLKTRALENRIPIVAPNVLQPPDYPGESAIIDLQFDAFTRIVRPSVALAGNVEAVIVAEVDLERARSLRRERFSERRPNAYISA